jgi:hypothetical protein
MTTTRRAAVAASPDEPPIDAATTTGTTTNAWSNWRYIGEHQLTYPAVPVTVSTGDVITHYELPAGDGRWESTDAEVTRHRDNHQEG